MVQSVLVLRPSKSEFTDQFLQTSWFGVLVTTFIIYSLYIVDPVFRVLIVDTFSFLNLSLPRVKSNHPDPPVRLMSELSDLDKFTPLQWHDCRIFLAAGNSFQMQMIILGWIKDSTFLLKDKWLSSLSTVLLSNLPYWKACEWNRRSKNVHGMRRCSYNSAENADETSNFEECINDVSTCTVKLSRGHHDNDQESWWSNLSRQHLGLVFIQWGFLDTAHRCYNPGFQVLQICLIHLMLVGHRPVFCLPYIALATQQFQAWTPNGSKHDSRTDLRFPCCLPLGVSSESSKYINFLSDWLNWLNFHEPRSGNDANIRSFPFSNSS